MRRSSIAGRSSPRRRRFSNSIGGEHMAKHRQIAVINAGSSSTKFAVFHDDPAQSLIFRGQMEKIGVAPTLTVEGSGGETILETEWGAKEINHGSATKVI